MLCNSKTGHSDVSPGATHDLHPRLVQAVTATLAVHSPVARSSGHAPVHPASYQHGAAQSRPRGAEARVVAAAARLAASHPPPAGCVCGSLQRSGRLTKHGLVLEFTSLCRWRLQALSMRVCVITKPVGWSCCCSCCCCCSLLTWTQKLQTASMPRWFILGPVRFQSRIVEGKFI
jgi:hypothetical protein